MLAENQCAHMSLVSRSKPPQRQCCWSSWRCLRTSPSAQAAAPHFVLGNAEAGSSSSPSQPRPLHHCVQRVLPLPKTQLACLHAGLTSDWWCVSTGSLSLHGIQKHNQALIQRLWHVGGCAGRAGCMQMCHCSPIAPKVVELPAALLLTAVPHNSCRVR